MNEFIEKNRRLLKFYCENLRSIGLLILILGLLSVCAIATSVLLSKFGYWHAPKSFEMIIAMPLSVFNIFFIGIGILGLVQFIRYLVERDYKPGWILRHGDMFFYLYALLTILSVVWVYTIAPSYSSPSIYTRVGVIFLTVISTTVKVLILVGLGQILRRLMPIIEESKSLV
jgi:hypothetical protein